MDIKLSKSVTGSQPLSSPAFCFLVAVECTAPLAVHCLPAGPEAAEQAPSLFPDSFSQVFVAGKGS